MSTTFWIAGAACSRMRCTSAGALAHEAVHVRQWRRYGMLMPLLYALAGRDALLGVTSGWE